MVGDTTTASRLDVSDGKMPIIAITLKVSSISATRKSYLCLKLAGKITAGRRGLSEVFKSIVKKAGLDPMIVPGKGIKRFSKRSFHSLRHSFNSALANSG